MSCPAAGAATQRKEPARIAARNGTDMTGFSRSKSFAGQV
jgi:hypothetical protein